MTEPETDLNATRKVLEAALFAARKHVNQKRKGAAAEPFINHPLEVAHLAAEALTEPDTNLVVAALLHDTVEDTDVTREDLIRLFGRDVADLVAEVTDDKTLEKSERKRLQIENAPKKSVRAQVIKLADKISNLRGVLSSPPVHWSPERRKEYFAWSRRVVDRLTAPNPLLKAEFDRLQAQFAESVRLTAPDAG